MERRKDGREGQGREKRGGERKGGEGDFRAITQFQIFPYTTGRAAGQLSDGVDGHTSSTQTEKETTDSSSYL